MFTGIIDHFGTIHSIEVFPKAHRIWVKTTFSQLQMGESIAIDGICLTVMEIKDDLFCCDISHETLNVTTAKQFQAKQPVNLERALLPTSRLGGHFVTGHVDLVASIKKITPYDEFIELELSGIDKKYLIQKGSIAINGVSLTINSLTPQGLCVCLIPHTLQRTNLQFLTAGNSVNIEFDMLAKITVEQCQQYLKR